jgi:hypothetical protein
MLTTRLSSAEIKNEWSYTSATLILLHGVDRTVLSFYILLATRFLSPSRSGNREINRPH